ncbi:hypothetical protein [Sphingomonas sp. BK069]|uniref:hypothetical protein n=1 Tax=Sphingomonas sp. BK069 TaxID=2586979 RepID=UPI00161D2D28|nr:hypothetical protein [Sphingomonas sp. BK069]MBB3347308.1 hypothetical protein [Sphingomonas sp. BK069]
MTKALLLLLRRFWPAIPIGLLAAALLLTRGQLTDARHDLALERSHQETADERAKRERAELEVSFLTRQAKATSDFADRLAAREPLIVHSTNTVREYAQTAAGRALCLGADRVRGIDALDASLTGTAPGPAPGSEGAVLIDSDPAPAGR